MKKRDLSTNFDFFDVFFFRTLNLEAIFSWMSFLETVAAPGCKTSMENLFFEKRVNF